MFGKKIFEPCYCGRAKLVTFPRPPQHLARTQTNYESGHPLYDVLKVSRQNAKKQLLWLISALAATRPGGTGIVNYRSASDLLRMK